MIGGGGREGNKYLHPSRFVPLDVNYEVEVFVDQVTHALPLSAVQLIHWAFPNYLELAVFRHSSQTYTVSILDTDNKYLTFRLNQSEIPHWTLVPVAGFCYGDDLKLQ